MTMNQSEFAVGRLAHKYPECYCDINGIGDPQATCGDCPRDYQPMSDADVERIVDGINLYGGDYSLAIAIAVEKHHGIGRN